MRICRYTEAQKVDVLRGAPRRQIDAGTPVVEVCRKLGVGEATFFRWRKRIGDWGTSELKELRQLRDEVRRLEALVADLARAPGGRLTPASRPDRRKTRGLTDRSRGEDQTHHRHCTYMRYYKLLENMHVEHRVLDWPRVQNARGDELRIDTFTTGEPYVGDVPLHVGYSSPGPILDVEFGPMGEPILRAPLARQLLACAPDDVQLIPIVISGDTEPSYLVNVTTRRECVDETLTDVAWQVGVDAETGREWRRYRHVHGLRIDPARTGGSHVFRVEYYPVIVVVSELVKDLFERTEALGAKFREV